MIGDLENPLLVDRNATAIGAGAKVYSDVGRPSHIAWTRGRCLAKRAIDIVLAAFGLIAMLPMLLTVAALIRLTSRGPALFWQDRVGRDGKPFRLCKFRTMYAGQGDPSGVQHTIEGDTRVTRLGRFLRQRSIDELPQLLNVLKGDMSLVGPRAHAVKMLVCGLPYEAVVDNYHLRHQVRPGITGLAQVRGLRGPVTDFTHARQRVEADLEYIANFSVTWDLVILVRTVGQELCIGSGV